MARTFKDSKYGRYSDLRAERMARKAAKYRREIRQSAKSESEMFWTERKGA